MDCSESPREDHCIHLILDGLFVQLGLPMRVPYLGSLDTIETDLETLGALTVDLCRKHQCAHSTLD